MVYDFECDTCHKVFEVTRRLNDEAAVPCPKCAGKTHKVFLTTPQINVSWKKTYGLGHSGQISLPPVHRAKRRKEKQHA